MELQDLQLQKPKESSNRDENGRFVKIEQQRQDTSIRDDDNLIPLKKYFGFSTEDPLEDGRLQSIMTELKHLGIKTDGEVMQKLKELELKLGRDYHENRTAKILTYLRLSRDVNDKLQQLRSFEKI